MAGNNENSQTDLTHFIETPKRLALTEIEVEFFRIRGNNESDFEIYNLFDKQQRDFLNREKFDFDDRNEFFKIEIKSLLTIKELMKDQMTGMFRREMLYRYTEAKLSGKTLDQIREMPMTIVAADFAGLGYFNKETHEGGDTALKVASGPMREIIKAMLGVSFRSGGDEFTFVINKLIGEAQGVGEKMRDELLKIDTSDPKAMMGFEFDAEMPLRIDLGYASISEGVDAWLNICAEVPLSEMCVDQNRDNQIIDLTYQIADHRAMYRKNISLLQFLITKYKKVGDGEDFDHFYSMVVMKNQVSKEDITRIAKIEDKSELSKTVFQFSRRMTANEQEKNDEGARIKQNIIKKMAQEPLKEITK